MTARTIPPRALILPVILTLIWGTNWPLFQIAVREVSVWTFRAVAVTVGGIALLMVAKARGQSLKIPRRYWPAIGAATLAYLVVWILVPIVAMVSGAVVHGEPLGLMQWGAMACCAAAMSLALLKPSANA